MVNLINPSDVEAAVRALVAAEQTNLGIEVTVPVAYGDGALATVVVEGTGDSPVVHDAGFGAMRLTAAGVPLSKHVVHRLNELVRRYRCSLEGGRVVANATVESLPYTVALVANASRSVADYAYEMRRQAESDFRLVVFEQLREIAGSRLRQHEEFQGRSGRIYRLPTILDVAERHPQNFVSALAHRNAVPQGFAMMHDLGAAFPEVERDAVYDESSDIRDEDKALLSSISIKVMSLMEAPMRFKGIIGHG